MTAKEFITDYIKNHKDNIDENGIPYFSNISKFFEEIGNDFIWNEDYGDSRWWKNLFCVQEINGKMIGYGWATTTGDDSIFDKGWSFDEDSICYVKEQIIKKTIYKKI
jgi:hypothetical protein